MPYRQQVFPPRCAAPKPSTTPSASQDHEEPAEEEEGTRGRSSSRGPQGRQRRNRSSTRGSRKCRRGTTSDGLMDQMANYVASGWKRDLTHFIGCCWAAQFTGWIGQGGYYHWTVAQQGLIHLVPHLQRQPMPRIPDAHPSGRPLPLRPAQTGTPATGASGKQPDRTQPAPGGSGQGSTPNQGVQLSTSGQGGKSTAPSQDGKSTASTKATNQPPQVEVGHQQPREVPSALPQVGEEWVIVPGLTGTKWSCAKLVIESLSPKGLPIRLGWRR